MSPPVRVPKVTAVRSTPLAATPPFTTQMPVSTSWVRPERRRSISAASTSEPGLPRIAPPATTTVSAPMTGSVRSPSATAAAFARARRSTAASGASPGRRSSATSEGATRYGTPRRSRSRARRGDAEASTTRGASRLPAPELRDDPRHQRFRAALLRHEVVGAVDAAGVALARDGRARVEHDRDVDPLHGGPDEVDHVLAGHGARDVELHDDHVRLLLRDR